jgi:hypothetical protein
MPAGVGSQLVDRRRCNVTRKRFGYRLVRRQWFFVTPAQEDGCTIGVSPANELGGESRLADTGLTRNENELRSSLRGLLEGRSDLLELGLAADKG